MIVLSRDEIFAELVNSLEELFEVPAAKISLDARLAEDLDLDSIDAVDLVVKLQALIGRRIQPEIFRTVRTVRDVVDCVETLVATPGAPAGAELAAVADEARG